MTVLTALRLYLKQTKFQVKRLFCVFLSKCVATQSKVKTEVLCPHTILNELCWSCILCSYCIVAHMLFWTYEENCMENRWETYVEPVYYDLYRYAISYSQLYHCKIPVFCYSLCFNFVLLLTCCGYKCNLQKNDAWWSCTMRYIMIHLVIIKVTTILLSLYIRVTMRYVCVARYMRNTSL